MLYDLRIQSTNMVSFNESVQVIDQNSLVTTEALRDHGGAAFRMADAFPEDNSGSYDLEGGDYESFLDSMDDGKRNYFDVTMNQDFASLDVPPTLVSMEMEEGNTKSINESFFDITPEEDMSEAESLPSLGMSDTSSVPSPSAGAGVNPDGRGILERAALQGAVMLGIPHLIGSLQSLFSDDGDDDVAAAAEKTIEEPALSSSESSLGSRAEMLLRQASEDSSRGGAMALQ